MLHIVSSLLILAAWAVVALRVTRFVVFDKLTDPPRRALIRWATQEDGRSYHSEGHKQVATLFHCPWCIGFWVSAVCAGLAVWVCHLAGDVLAWAGPWWTVMMALPWVYSYIVGRTITGEE